MTEMLVLVDEHDQEIGTEEKLAAHRAGKLHRAFSIYVFNPRGEVLLTRRAAGKYHSGGLWTNTCCGHPRPGEPIAAAARRRLHEELGFDCDLRPAFQFTYRAEFPNGLIEHEIDHVFIGTHAGQVSPDPAEADAIDWVDPAAALRDVKAQPEKYTVWLERSIDRVVAQVTGPTGAPTPAKM